MPVVITVLNSYSGKLDHFILTIDYSVISKMICPLNQLLFGPFHLSFFIVRLPLELVPVSGPSERCCASLPWGSPAYPLRAVTAYDAFNMAYIGFIVEHKA